MSDHDSSIRCETCRFVEDLGHCGEEAFSCHRSAPAVEVVSRKDQDRGRLGSDRYCMWPLVDKEDWCGEWKAIPKTPEYTIPNSKDAENV